MSRYATVAQMQARFDADELEQLTDRDGSAGAIVEPVLQGALEDACADIDLYLVTRYQLPLAQVPTVLERVCCDIARYRLYDTRVTDQVRDRYLDAVRLLDALAKGNVALGLADGSEPAGDEASIEVQSSGSVFGRGNGGFL
ncbi:gp436 family protein [Ferrimonas sp.]|uniref:gp436 family protein n=1 Tax=Ferrimonas sp. TaxID=2080861 RepID=UPI003A8F8C02